MLSILSYTTLKMSLYKKITDFRANWWLWLSNLMFFAQMNACNVPINGYFCAHLPRNINTFVLWLSMFCYQHLWNRWQDKGLLFSDVFRFLWIRWKRNVEKWPIKKSISLKNVSTSFVYCFPVFMMRERPNERPNEKIMLLKWNTMASKLFYYMHTFFFGVSVSFMRSNSFEWMFSVNWFPREGK